MTHKAICSLCEATCGLQVTVEEGRVTGIRGDDADLFSQGYLCPKGYALKELEEDPDRLRAPQLRQGREWRTVSWEEAFQAVAAGLGPLWRERGRDAVALYLGNPNVHNLSGQLYLPALIRALGTRNLFSASTLDQMPKHVSCGLMFGDPMSVPVPDLDRLDYLLILGANPLVSNGSMMTVPNVRARLKRIPRVVVVDPRRTRTAAEAAEHHFIRPGRDVFLLLGMVHQLFAEGRVAPGRLEPHLRGLAELREAVQEYPPDRCAELCGLPAPTIARLARELSEAPRAAVYGRLGLCTHEHGTLANWLVDVLNVLTGNLDREGGAMFPRAAAGARNTAGLGPGKGFRLSQQRSRARGLTQVMGEMPTVTLADEILTPGEGQVRGLITVAGNPALSAPDSARLEEALATLEFMVSVDCYRNETTRHAHVLLPVPSHLQRAHYDILFAQLAVHNHARFAPPVLPLDPGQPDEWEILLQLASIASSGAAQASVAPLDELVFRQLLERETKRRPLSQDELQELAGRRGPERLLDLMLRCGPYGLTLGQLEAAPEGIDLGPLQPRVPELLMTASGQIELAPEPLLADLQRLRQVSADPPSSLLLIGRRDLRSNNSWMHNLQVLVKGPAVCTLLIHPEDAERLQLSQGERVRVVGQSSLEIPVEITDSIMPGVVSIPHGWGHAETGQQVARQHAGSNANRLLSTRGYDPISGTAVQNGVPVTIEKLG